jgi:hypothetical protein
MEEGNSDRASVGKDLERVLMKALRASLSTADSSLLKIENQSRPVLRPMNNLEGIIDSQSGLVQWGRQGSSIAPMRGFENIGGGPAFNIYAVFFGKPFQGHPPRERYAVWNYGILKAGEEGPPLILSQGTSIESTHTINGHPLYVPDDPRHNGVLAHLTITYEDTPGRKYASIFDYHRFIGWRRVSDVENIEYDLNELDAMHPMTQQANEFFWRLGQNRP